MARRKDWIDRIVNPSKRKRDWLDDLVSGKTRRTSSFRLKEGIGERIARGRPVVRRRASSGGRSFDDSPTAAENLISMGVKGAIGAGKFAITVPGRIQDWRREREIQKQVKDQEIRQRALAAASRQSEISQRAVQGAREQAMRSQLAWEEENAGYVTPGFRSRLERYGKPELHLR